MYKIKQKYITFGVMIIHRSLLRRRFIPKKSLFGVLYGQREQFVHTFSQVTVNGMNWKMLIWKTFSSAKTGRTVNGTRNC